jgi:hypothetical protein
VQGRGGVFARDAHAAFAALLVLGCAAAFYAPAVAATGGDWPVPLDDVFIHYDFARATAHLHPFEWIAGQGYSSGETSALYPFLLAPGYLLGFRGLWLGAWAALLACASLFVTLRALRELVAPCPEWVAWLGALMLVSVGVLDWTWWSGMEGAVFTAAVAITLTRTKRAREAAPTERRQAQWAVGAWSAVLVGLRPEALVLVPLFAVVVARRALSQSALAALARCAGPGTLLVLAVLTANRVFTGDAPSAGALAKLLSYRPFLSDVDRARTAVENTVYFGALLYRQLGHKTPVALLLPFLAIPALFSHKTRALAFVCLVGAVLWTLLVSWNVAARFQNFRYFMPAVALVLFASTLGLSALARSKARGAAFGALALVGVAFAVTGVPEQIDFFVNASKNIHDQQVEVGRRLAARMPEGTSVLVGDAGAIPYVSGHAAVDALGLGGYANLPFARAAALGEGATVELIERIAPRDRPSFLALYPTWFGDITRLFGREVDHVSIEKNFICGGLTKGIYEADWSTLADGPAEPPAEPFGRLVDTLDVADVVSEREHDYVSPEPDGGWASLDVRTDERGARRFDAGRTILEGQSERFTLRADAPVPAAIWVRTDESEARVEARATREGAEVGRLELTRVGSRDGTAWGSASGAFGEGLRRGDVVTLRSLGGSFRAFHVWVVSGG